MARSVLLLMVGAIGCAGPQTPPQSTLHFLVADIFMPYEIDWVEHRLPAAGFDLDGIDSDGSAIECTDARDYPYLPTFRSPPTGGVDNALFHYLLQVDEPAYDRVAVMNELLRRSIHEGAYSLVLEVSGIDSFESDPSVEVRSVLARAAGCDGGAECPLQADASGALVAGQILVLVTPEPVAATGAISSGRLRVTLPRMAGPLVGYDYATGEWRPPVPSELVVLEAAISPDALVAGMLGGTFQVNDAGRAFDHDPAGADDYPDLLVFGDFSPRRDDARLCDRMSFGVTFDAIRVQVDGDSAPDAGEP